MRRFSCWLRGHLTPIFRYTQDGHMGFCCPCYGLVWRVFPQRASAAFWAWAVRCSGLSAMRAFVAFWAFLALLSAFLADVMRPSVTAAGFFRFAIPLGSIQ